MRNQKGFTLIELMVVVLIIAILIAIAVPVFNVARESAWRRSCQSNLRNINGTIQTYAAANEGNVNWAAVCTPIGPTHPFIPQYFQTPPECAKAKSNGEAPPYYRIEGTDQITAKSRCEYYAAVEPRHAL